MVEKKALDISGTTKATKLRLPVLKLRAVESGT